MRNVLYDLICTAGYLGKIPRMPGTAGTLAGVGIFLGLYAAGADHPLVILGTAAIVAALGIALTPWARERYGRSDPQVVVIDEVAGYLVSVALFIPGLSVWAAAGAGFVFFRIFDILKPPPVSWIDRSASRASIVGDDLAAGVYASLCLHALAFILGGPSA